MQDSQGQFTEINAFKGKLREAYFFEKQISDKQAKKLADICAKKQASNLLIGQQDMLCHISITTFKQSCSLEVSIISSVFKPLFLIFDFICGFKYQEGFNKFSNDFQNLVKVVCHSTSYKKLLYSLFN